MKKKKVISFIARKVITKPVQVKFKTNDGKVVSFIARKKITKPVRVKFKTKK